jgi:hypothetical protein
MRGVSAGTGAPDFDASAKRSFMCRTSDSAIGDAFFVTAGGGLAADCVGAAGFGATGVGAEGLVAEAGAGLASG